jgi:transcriptional regulator with XRE-family HTH domain
VEAGAHRAAVEAGALVSAERARRRWTLDDLSLRSGLSRSGIHGIEAGRAGSILAYARLASALGLRFGPLLSPMDARRPRWQSADAVHAAMGEVEARRLRIDGRVVRLDEPFQHFHFAGRADLVACDLGRRALLHIENKTQVPDVQELAGSFNVKREYLGRAMAERAGIDGGWGSETHVLALLWSAEVLHVIRRRRASFEAIAPDPPDPLIEWWAGQPPEAGRHASVVVFDPILGGRSDRRTIIGLEEALAAKPRYRDYRDALERLRVAGLA